jgi:hypothetical protein
MTDEQIVRALAEAVMEWEEPTSCRCRHWQQAGNCLTATIDFWNPLTNDADSCDVMDKMAELEMQPTLRHAGKVFDSPAAWELSWDDPETFDIVAGPCLPDRRRAVAIAALKAKGAWQEPSNAE